MARRHLRNKQRCISRKRFQYDDYAILKEFTGSHPVVMAESSSGPLGGGQPAAIAG